VTAAKVSPTRPVSGSTATAITRGAASAGPTVAGALSAAAAPASLLALTRTLSAPGLAGAKLACVAPAISDPPRSHWNASAGSGSPVARALAAKTSPTRPAEGVMTISTIAGATAGSGATATGALSEVAVPSAFAATTRTASAPGAAGT
jgi:hypothetical protein